MNKTQTRSSTHSSQKILFAMAGIDTMCALLIVLTYEGTLPRIKRLKAEALKEAIFKVLPNVSETRPFVLNGNGKLVPAEDESNNQINLFAGYGQKGQLKGVAIEAAGQGYAGEIKILYGYDPSAEAVVGFHVLESKETPGLGDKIETDPDFLANFQQLEVSLNDSQTGLAHEVKTVKSGEKEHPWQVDGITGATISSRAIGDIINKSMQRWAPLIQQQKETLMLNSRTEMP